MSNTGETKRTTSRSVNSVCDCASFAHILTDVKKKMDTCHKIIVAQNAKIEELNSAVAVLTAKLEEINVAAKEAPAVQNISYRDAVKRTMPEEHLLLVKPANDEQRDSLKQKLVRKINPEDLQVGVQINKACRCLPRHFWLAGQ
ncbi:unnamed protein product [Acanthoscelides obtectus]|uniref:Uncharacterized protein n=1 Tax=Acanthoscelides obtectus TaxID=200917 RepID=A0A9P0PTK0_ACAOB|nr:unnamed protein product [Acanthoscelides obtectus]CAK1663556.1 hypothetical protein AOBTE_LOCUS23729 [Acanthoscelides obtectus]